MRTFIIIAFLFFGIISWGQNKIQSYEYWFNGNYAAKQQQSVTPAARYTLNTAVPTNTLSEGLHIFNLRFKDDSARYSSTISQFFYKHVGGATGNTNMNGYQYWFDNNFAAAAIQTVGATATLNLNAPINAAALTNGLHLFHIRFRDNTNQWSSTISQFFYKAEPNPLPGANMVNGYQYWFDNDFASAAMQAVTPSNTYNLNAPISATTLSNGLHLFHIRFKDASNQWSNVISQFFYKSEPNPTPGANQMMAYQYWFDSDFGNAANVSITPTTEYQMSAAISTAALTPGLHLLNVRFKDQRSQWSSTISQFVYTTMGASGVRGNAVSKMQFWFDNDFNAAQSKALSTQPVVQVTDMIDANTLPDGLHILNVRFADTVGQWSSTISQFFYKSAEVGITTNVISGYRYWFNDEGASKMVFHGVPDQNPFQFNTTIDMGCLTLGANRLHVQFLDKTGLWSTPMTDTITLISTQNIYRFTGNGNWSNAANWLNNSKPALDLPGCKEILIDNTPGGSCILDVPQYLLKNSKITVLAGKKLVIPQNLEIKQQ
jgi:hypothetical protein